MFGIESYKNKDELLEEQYKAKYLKYKQKYNELKQTGGIFSNDYSVGEYVFLTTQEKANELLKLFNICSKPSVEDIDGVLTGNLAVNNDTKKQELKTMIQNFYLECNNPSKDAINQTLHDNAYRIKLNSQEAILVKSNTTTDLLKKRFAKIGNKEPTFTFNNTQKVDSKQNKNVYKGPESLNVIKNAIDNANSGNRDKDKTLKMSHYVRVKFSETGMIGNKKSKFELMDVDPQLIPQ
jgi:hypothetical protein